MAGVAIVTDSAADLTPDVAAAAGITVVPLAVTFGAETFRAGVDLSTEQFWERMLAPSAPFPTTAAASPGEFRDAYEACFAGGSESVVCITISEKLSGTLKSATIAREMLPDRDIHVIDSRTASMGHGLLSLLAAELARQGRPASEVAAIVEKRIDDVDLYVALDTLEYVRRGGRMNPAQAAIGSLLAVKPIITVRDGLVGTAERVRTRSKARERVLELVTERPVEQVAILYTPPADHQAFRADVVARLAGRVPESMITVQPVGPSVGPHIGPGCLGGVVLLAAGHAAADRSSVPAGGEVDPPVSAEVDAHG